MRIFAIILICTLSISISHGQDKKKKTSQSNESIDVFGSPSTGSTTVKNKSSNKKSTSDEEYDYDKNMIKIDPLQVINGYILISYERLLTRRIGLEVLGGPTIPTLGSSLVGVGVLSDEDLGYEFGAKKFGKYIGANIKYYTDSYDAPDGYYVGIGFRFTELLWDKPKDINQNSFYISSTKKTEFIRTTIGQNSIDDNFIWDWYFTLGLHNLERTTFNHNQPIGKEKDVEKKLGFSFTIGVKLGFPF